MYALANLINSLISLYIFVVFASVIASWLIAFNVLNARNRFVFVLVDFLYRATEPALRPIRRVIPSIGNIDISPLILILLLYFLRDLVIEILV